jgi:hypothetical protein
MKDIERIILEREDILEEDHLEKSDYYNRISTNLFNEIDEHIYEMQQIDIFKDENGNIKEEMVMATSLKDYEDIDISPGEYAEVFKKAVKKVREDKKLEEDEYGVEEISFDGKWIFGEMKIKLKGETLKEKLEYGDSLFSLQRKIENEILKTY